MTYRFLRQILMLSTIAFTALITPVSADDVLTESDSAGQFSNKVNTNITFSDIPPRNFAHMSLVCDLVAFPFGPGCRPILRDDNGDIDILGSGTIFASLTIEELRNHVLQSVPRGQPGSFCERGSPPDGAVLRFITVTGSIFPAGASYEFSCF